MTFLEICQRLRYECDIAGAQQATAPSSVVSQSGILGRLVMWAANAWDEIQGRYPNWRWMRSTWSLNTTSNDGEYAFGDVTDVRAAVAITRFKRWWPLDDENFTNVRVYQQSVGVGSARWLPYLPWNQFRSIYEIGIHPDAQPVHFTIDPQNRIILGPEPDAVYVLSGEYQKSKQTLSVDGDTPELPTDYHMLIVYRAMEKYGAFKSASEVYNRGVLEGGRLMRQLELDQVPPMKFAAPMA